MGLLKHAPNAAVEGVMGWTPTTVKICGNMLRIYTRLNSLDKNRSTLEIAVKLV